MGCTKKRHHQLVPHAERMVGNADVTQGGIERKASLINGIPGYTMFERTPLGFGSAITRVRSRVIVR